MKLLLAVGRAVGRAATLADSGSDFHRTDLALGLHMLHGVAPSVFHQLELHGLFSQALRRLDGVPTAFPPELEWFEVMARLDALYLRAIRGEAVKRFPKRAAVAAVERLRDGGQLLPAWLCAGLLEPLGPKVRVRLPARPFSDDRLARLAYLTHVVLLRTHYLAKKAKVSGAVLDELAAAVPWAQRAQEWDLLGELVFCLLRCGRTVRPATIDALLGAQWPDGHFEDAQSDDRQRLHTTLSCLLALAAAHQHA
jgi:hypothetical protein